MTARRQHRPPAAARIAAAAAMAFAVSSSAQTLSVSIDPAQKTYYAGQRVSCIVALDLDGAEVDGGGNLSLAGLPDSGPALRFGRFEHASQGAGGELRWIAPLELLAPTNFTLAPRMSGTMRRETSRRGSFFRQYALGPFDAEAAPLRVEVAPVPAADAATGGDAASGAPASGAVGPLAFRASLSPLDCSPGDLLTLRWSLSGPGAEGGQPVAWSPGPGFKAYPPRVEKRAGGVLDVSQVVVPLDASATNAAPFSVRWFDPRSGWATGSAGPFAISYHERRIGDDQGASDAASTAPHGEQKFASPSPASQRGGGLQTAVSSAAQRGGGLQTAVPSASAQRGGGLQTAVPSASAQRGGGLQTAVSSAAAQRGGGLQTAVSSAAAQRGGGLQTAVSATVSASSKARFAPGPKAKVLFDLAPGTPVRVVEVSGNWARVAAPDGAAGWIPAAELQ